MLTSLVPTAKGVGGTVSGMADWISQIRCAVANPQFACQAPAKVPALLYPDLVQASTTLSVGLEKTSAVSKFAYVL